MPVFCMTRDIFFRYISIKRERNKNEAMHLWNCLLNFVPLSCHLSVGTCYTFSFASAIMHRIESLLIASSLKKRHADYCNQNVIATTKIPTIKVLEAITTKKCQEKFDLESLVALGDSFLKYAACQQGLIRNEPFDPKMWIIPGNQMEAFHEGQLSTGTKVFTKGTRKIKSKVVADVVEALIGVFLSCGGEAAALSFMNWLGIEVDFRNVPYQRSFQAHPKELLNISYLESLLKYSFAQLDGLEEDGGVH